MIGGAATAAPAVCKAIGCCQPVRARGMCSKHYQRWQQAHDGEQVHLVNRQAVLDALPARVDQIAEITNLSKQAIRRHLKKLHEDGLARIQSFDPPDVSGHKFEPVWAQGEGEHAVLRRARVRDYDRARQRRNYARRKAQRAGWLGPLGLRAPT